MLKKQSYVVGFLFDEPINTVALVEKNRPKWQAGNWNGIGGHIEEGELPLDAMRREFEEETGVDIESWELFYVGEYGHYEGQLSTVYFYKAFSEKISDVTTIEDEQIDCFEVGNLPENKLYNLSWLIPLAADKYESWIGAEENVSRETIKDK